jgi:hypothetical protein
MEARHYLARADEYEVRFDTSPVSGQITRELTLTSVTADRESTGGTVTLTGYKGPWTEVSKGINNPDAYRVYRSAFAADHLGWHMAISLA